MTKSTYEIPTGSRVKLSPSLTEEIKKRFADDRENRFQLFILSRGIRKKYLDKDGAYSEEFQKWYTASGMNDLFGSMSNFTKYAGCGDVVSYVGTKTSDPEKYLKQLPLSVGSLYEISMILKSDKEVFKACLHYTPKRKSKDEPKHEWKTPRPALISKSTSELKVRTWRRNWENPPPPKEKRTDKRTLPFVKVSCSGELYDFDKKTGEKTGRLDLDEVERFFSKLNDFFKKECPDVLQFKMEDSMDVLTEGYIKRKERVDPARKVTTSKDKTSKYK